VAQICIVQTLKLRVWNTITCADRGIQK